MPITVPTPMMMPSIVSNARTLLIVSAVQATRMASNIFIALLYFKLQIVNCILQIEEPNLQYTMCNLQLLRTPRLDRAEPRGIQRREEAKRDADDRRDECGQQNGAERYGCLRALGLEYIQQYERAAEREHIAETDANRAAEETQHHRLDQELEQNIAAPRAAGLTQADLAGALGHTHQHDVHDPDAADQQRDAADQAQKRVEAVDDAANLIGNLLRVEHRKVVVLIRQPVALAQ